jgi:hypothetical protein
MNTGLHAFRVNHKKGNREELSCCQRRNEWNLNRGDAETRRRKGEEPANGTDENESRTGFLGEPGFQGNHILNRDRGFQPVSAAFGPEAARFGSSNAPRTRRRLVSR